MRLPFKLKSSGLAVKIIPLVLVFLLLMLFMPHSSKWRYDYKKGSTWKYDDLVSEFDFPLMKTPEQMRLERARSRSSVVPYYNYSENVVNKALKAAEGISFDGASEVKSAVLYSMKAVFDKGIISDGGLRVEDEADDSDDAVLYVKRDKRVVKTPSTEIYRLSAARAKVLAYVRDHFKLSNPDSLLNALGVYDLIVPNLNYDPQATDLVNSMSDNFVSPTMGYVRSGELIVSNGEIITPEVHQMLDSYKKEYESNVGAGSPGILHLFGNALICLAVVFLLGMGIYLSSPEIFDDTGSYLYIILLFAIGAVAALVLGRIGATALYVFPFALLALFLQAFFKPKVTVVLYLLMLIPLLLPTESGVPLFLMHLAAGFISLYTFRYFNRGWKQFINALVIFAALAILYFAFRFTGLLEDRIITGIPMLLLGSVLVVAGYPLIFIFEKMFDLLSSTRLQELCDTNNELVRELELKAPGTFQHSLQVMNMADAAARSIDANRLLVRAGALYHDIGKMNNPLCFVENESLSILEDNDKYHDGLSPERSAADIIRHVRDGYEIAKKNSIPRQISDFILSHHGTGCVSYFYDKFRREGGDASQRASFCYEGSRPTSPEQVIVMLADSLEAASRTLRDYSQESVSKLVESIVQDKIDDGQLEDAEISIRQLGIIKDAYKTYIIQAHHGRVTYPKKNKINK